MKYFGAIILCLALLGILFAGNDKLSAERYSEVEIFLPQASQMKQLNQIGLIFDHIKVLDKEQGGLHFKAVLNSSELEILRNSAFTFKITIPDVVQYYLNRQKELSAQAARQKDLPAGFEYGSMGGYYTFDEVVNELDSMSLNYPNLISTKQSIGQSIENRDLWMVKLSDNPEVAENEPEVLFTGLHHAREPQGMMNLMYFMDYLLENYGIDAQITYLLDHRQIFVLPVVNPDGYVYNEQTNPNGGGQWRKNRRPVQNWYGVDLNRNYGYNWGYDNEGSSPYPFSDTYRGEAPFSEPETQAVRNFVLSQNLNCVLNYHTYGNVLIFPWSYTNALTPDSLYYMELADLLTGTNHYNFGNTYQTINYNANGDADDWFYGEQSEKNKIFALTPEVGDDSDGFWPTRERIVPLCEENLYANLRFVWLAGEFPQARSFRIISDDNDNGFAEPGEQIQIVCQSKNLGLADAPSVSIELSSNLSGLQINNSGNHVHLPFASQTIVSDTFWLSIDEQIESGTQAWLMLNYQLDGFTLQDTLGTLVVGTPVVVFSDDAESGLDNWQSNLSWGIENDALTSGNLVFSDSPSGHYRNDADNTLTLKQPLQLPAADFIYLTYRAYWDVERVYDFATVEISTDSLNWNTLRTVNMMAASGKGQQTNGTSGYDGYCNYWQQEWIDISDYHTAAEVYLRFRLQSDGGVTKDGFYLDDIQVLAYNTLPSALAGEQVVLPDALELFNAYPNPFNATTTFHYVLNRLALVNLSIFDIQGRKITTLIDKVQAAGTHNYSFNAGHLASGIYLVKLQAGKQTKIKKVVLVK